MRRAQPHAWTCTKIRPSPHFSESDGTSASSLAPAGACTGSAWTARPSAGPPGSDAPAPSPPAASSGRSRSASPVRVILQIRRKLQSDPVFIFVASLSVINHNEAILILNPPSAFNLPPFTNTVLTGNSQKQTNDATCMRSTLCWPRPGCKKCPLLREESARRAHLRLVLGERLDHGAALQHLLHVLHALRHLLQPALHVLHREDQVDNLRVNTLQGEANLAARLPESPLPLRTTIYLAVIAQSARALLNFGDICCPAPGGLCFPQELALRCGNLSTSEIRGTKGSNGFPRYPDRKARTLLSSTPTAATAPTALVWVFKSAYEAPTSRHPVITSDRHPDTARPRSLIPRAWRHELVAHCCNRTLAPKCRSTCVAPRNTRRPLQKSKRLEFPESPSIGRTRIERTYLAVLRCHRQQRADHGESRATLWHGFHRAFQCQCKSGRLPRARKIL